MDTSRLNVFQRLARRWDAVHPYNAGQGCRVAGRFSQAEVSAAWGRSSDSRGAARVDELADHADLSRHFTREMNRPFPSAAPSPFRPFVQRAGDSTWLGVVYQHWVADSVSIRAVLHEWTGRLASPVGDRGRPRVNQVSCRSRDVVTGWRRPWRLDETLLRLLRRYGDNRRVRKIHTFGPLEYPVRVRLFPAPPGILPRLVTYARARGVTLNDVLLAALAQACDRLIPVQERPGRDDLALSSVADLRTGLPEPVRSGFGCLLGFTTTVCRARDLGDWDRLLSGVAAQSRTQRRAGVGPASVLWMLAAELALRYTPAARVYDFYRKEIPLAAGVSNVNLTDTWVTDGSAPLPVLDYVRVSPTGPIVPVALAVTSVGTEIRLGLTYRTALLNDWTATELVQDFSDRLSRIAWPREGVS